MYLGLISPIKMLNKYSRPFPLQYCYSEVAMQSSEYFKFYEEIAKQSRVVFLDCSPKFPRSTKGYSERDILVLSRLINPKYIVLPCVDYSDLLTLKWSKETLDYFKKNPPGEIGTKSTIRYMGLPQGRTKEQVEQNAKDLLGLPGVNVLGLSAPLETVYSREGLKLDPKKSVLLDIYESIEEEACIQEMIGLITSFPIRLGILNKRFLDKCSKIELDFNHQVDTSRIESNVLALREYFEK